MWVIHFYYKSSQIYYPHKYRYQSIFFFYEMLCNIFRNPGNMQKNYFFNRILPLKRCCENIFEKFIKKSESAFKNLPVSMIDIFINEYFHNKYIKITWGLNCFLSLRKLKYYGKLSCLLYLFCYTYRQFWKNRINYCFKGRI